MEKRILLLFAAVTLMSNLFPQDPIPIPRLEGSIVFDGMPDEEVWQLADPFPFTMHTPVFGKEPTETTDARMFFNDKYLYVGVKMFYADVGIIARSGKQRDYFSGACDWFGLFLDTFNDHENAMMFYTNPNGLRWDATVKNDAAMGLEDININWNTFWDVETGIDSLGWYAEFRIPLSSLRFQVEEGRVNMGLSFMRYIAEKNESDLFPAIPPNWPNANWKPSQAAPIEFYGLKPGKPVYLTPYLLVGYDRNRILNDDETAYTLENTPKLEPGFDFKYGLTNNLTLDVTLNTDFAQVEADDQQINLTRLSLFFPEKRPFFLEKADVFDFPLAGGNNLFYSRRIGLSEGKPVRIYGGARITGRAGKWDLGILDMQTAPSDELTSENFGVFRTKRSLFNQNSYIGSMLTTRLGTDSTYNIAYGIDGVIRLFKDDYLTIRWAQTFGHGEINDPLSRDPSRLFAQWERRTQKGFGYDLLYTWSGQSFNPGIGFEIKDNYWGGRLIAKYGWLPPEERSNLRLHNLSHSFTFLYSSADYNLESVMSTTKWEFEARGGSSANVAMSFFREEVYDSLDFIKADVPPGTYNFWFASAMFNMSSSRNPRVTIQADAGQFFDGTKLSLTLAPAWNVSSSLDLSTTYKIDIVNFDGRNQEFINHIIGFKALSMFSTKISFITFAQYNTAIDAFIINGRFRFNPREGNDLYIVYNEGLNTDLYHELPTLPRSANRTVMMKYTYTFGF